MHIVDFAIQEDSVKTPTTKYEINFESTNALSIWLEFFWVMIILMIIHNIFLNFLLPPALCYENYYIYLNLLKKIHICALILVYPLIIYHISKLLDEKYLFLYHESIQGKNCHNLLVTYIYILLYTIYYIYDIEALFSQVRIDSLFETFTNTSVLIFINIIKMNSLCYMIWKLCS